jgi:hypothetical protein
MLLLFVVRCSVLPCTTANATQNECLFSTESKGSQHMYMYAAHVQEYSSCSPCCAVTQVGAVEAPQLHVCFCKGMNSPVTRTGVLQVLCCPDHSVQQMAQ